MNREEACSICGAALITLSHICYPLSPECPDSCDIVRDSAYDIAEVITQPSSDLSAAMRVDFGQL